MSNYKRVFVATLVLALSVGAFAQDAKSAAAPASTGKSGYHQVAKWDVGGEGGWDYLTFDPAGKRLFISRGTHVMVLDADSGKVVGDIADTAGVHGIAIAQDLGKGFTSNGRDNSVTIFDLKTLKAIDKVSVTPAVNPDAIMYEPNTKRIFTFNGRSKDATVIDAVTGKVLGTVAIGGKPEFAVADGTGTVFANDEDKAEVDVIDAKAMTIKSRWPLSTEAQKCEEPSGLALDNKDHRLFAVCGNKVMVVMNAQDGKVVKTVPTGAGTDAAAFDPGTGMAFASNGRDATLTIIHQDSADNYSVVDNVPTMTGARTMALDPQTHKAYLVTAQFGPAPAATTENPRPRAPMVPNSFTVLVYGK
ncbi:MAG: beta-propeller repeat-containing protein [Acidobacteriaceae bacterium]|nr:beta-propeller repeat-containing protein [Acidobacteriaceae bacterium]